MGIFVVSIIGNVIPFFPIPYLAAVYFYATLLPHADPFLVGIVSSAGATLGKVAIFYSSRLVGKAFLSKETMERYERLGKLIGNYGALGVFILAATPSPDDVVIVPLGLMNYSFPKFLIGVLAGKIVISVITASAGVVIRIVGGDIITSFLLAIVLFVLIMVVLYLLDWEAILGTLGEKGVRGLVEHIRSEGFSAFMLRKSTKSKEMP